MSVDNYTLNYGIEHELILKKTNKFNDIIANYIYDELFDKDNTLKKEYFDITALKIKLLDFFYYDINPKYSNPYKVIYNFINRLITITNIRPNDIALFFKNINICDNTDVDFSKLLKKILCKNYKKNNKLKFTEVYTERMYLKNINLSQINNIYGYYYVSKKELSDSCGDTDGYNFLIDIDFSVSTLICNYKQINYYNNIKNKDFQKLSNNDIIPYIEIISGIYKSINDLYNGTHLLFKYLNKEFNDTNLLLNNNTTSNHIHISFNIDNNVLYEPNLEFILIFIYLWCLIEPFIFKLCIKSRRNNYYCKMCLKTNNISIKNNIDDIIKINDDYITKYSNIINLFNGYNKYKNNRYFAINLLNLSKSKNSRAYKPTIEFRIKHGSNDAYEIFMFCTIIDAIFNIAKNDYKYFIVNREIIFDNYYKDIINILNNPNINNHEYDLNYTNIDDKNIIDILLNFIYNNIDTNKKNKYIKYWKRHINDIYNFNNHFNFDNIITDEAL